MTKEDLLALAKKKAHEAVDDNAKLSEERFLSASGSAAESGDIDWEAEARDLAHEFLENAESDVEDDIDAADDGDLDDDLPDEDDDGDKP